MTRPGVVFAKNGVVNDGGSHSSLFLSRICGNRPVNYNCPIPNSETVLNRNERKVHQISVPKQFSHLLVRNRVCQADGETRSACTTSKAFQEVSDEEVSRFYTFTQSTRRDGNDCVSRRSHANCGESVEWYSRRKRLSQTLLVFSISFGILILDKLFRT